MSSPFYASNGKGFYSVQWINTSYTGPIFKFRRSSDNALLDFYTSLDGKQVGTTLGGGGTSLSSWLSGSTAFVNTWYDQSTLGNHATQSTTARQPTYDSTSLCLNFVSSSSQFLNLPNGTVPSGNSNYTVVINHGTLQSQSGLLGSGTTSNNQENSFALTGTTYINYWWNNDFIAGSYAANNKVSWKYNGSTRFIYINGTLFSSANASGRNSGTANNYIGLGETANNNYANGQINCILIYSTALSDTDRLSAEYYTRVPETIIPPSYPCFREGTQILRLYRGVEDYTPVESLQRGDLIRTSTSGYKPISLIGQKQIYNSQKSDIKNRLYRYSTSICPELFEDLFVTGEHCALVNVLSDEKLQAVKEYMGDIYVTEGDYRVPAHLDERAVPYEKEGPVTIWHFALEHSDPKENYGVFANGLLVESASEDYLQNYSGMKLIE